MYYTVYRNTCNTFVLTVKENHEKNNLFLLLLALISINITTITTLISRSFVPRNQFSSNLIFTKTSPSYNGKL